MVIILKSIVIGICAIMPGVSGSVIAIAFGVYDQFIKSMSCRSNFRRNIIFILQVFVGVLFGIYVTSNFLIYIFKYNNLIYYSLTGIILSELPFLINKIHSNGKMKIIPLLISFVISLIFDVVKGISINMNKKMTFFIGGILFSFGKVFPGISSSFFLLSLGIYENIIIIITKPILLIENIDLYFPFIIGVVIGIIIFYKLLLYLLQKKYELTYSIIIGFLISSIFTMLPKFKLDVEHFLGVLLMILSFIIFVYIKAKNKL